MGSFRDVVAMSAQASGEPLVALPGISMDAVPSLVMSVTNDKHRDFMPYDASRGRGSMIEYRSRHLAATATRWGVG